MQPAANDPTHAAISAVRAIYADLEKNPVERDCVRRTECCQFKLTGRTPMLTAGEALVAAAGLKATGRREVPASLDEKAGRCPMLNPTGKCIIYDSRPFGCRTHFCAAAGGPYSRNEVRELVRRLEDVDASLGGDGPHVLHTALKFALEKILHPPRGAQRR